MKCRRFRLENGEGVGDRDEVNYFPFFYILCYRQEDFEISQLQFQVYNSPTTPVLENPEYQTRWYFKYFLGKCKLNSICCHLTNFYFFFFD